MGVWYYLFNYTRKEYIFLGSGEPFFGPKLQSAIQYREWQLTDEISVIPDSHFGDTIGKHQRTFTALYHHPEIPNHFKVEVPKKPVDEDEMEDDSNDDKDVHEELFSFAKNVPISDKPSKLLFTFTTAPGASVNDMNIGFPPRDDIKPSFSFSKPKVKEHHNQFDGRKNNREDFYPTKPNNNWF